MGWQITQFAEIVRGGDQTATKNVMPETVDHDPGCERVAFQIGQMFGELQAATAGGVEWRGIKGVEESARDDFRRLLVITTHKKGRVFGIGLDHAGNAGGFRDPGFDLPVARDQGGDAGELFVWQFA